MDLSLVETLSQNKKESLRKSFFESTCKKEFFLRICIRRLLFPFPVDSVLWEKEKEVENRRDLSGSRNDHSVKDMEGRVLSAASTLCLVTDHRPPRIPACACVPNAVWLFVLYSVQRGSGGLARTEQRTRKGKSVSEWARVNDSNYRT